MDSPSIQEVLLGHYAATKPWPILESDTIFPNNICACHLLIEGGDESTTTGKAYQDTRDGSHSCLIEIVLIRQGHPSLTLEVEENWTLEYVRKELEVAIQNPPDQFCFKLDGRKVSRRREHQIICKDVAAPHELEALEDI